MNLNDIIALAKQGYKLADIKELIALADVTEPEAPDPEIKDDAEKSADDDRPEKAAASEPDAEPDAIDYKKLYEEEKMKLEKLQKENINKNIEKPKPSIEEQLADVVRGFM